MPKKNKLTADGQPITPAKIKSWNESYRRYPLQTNRFVTADGDGVLAHPLCYQPRPCGCAVTGNGSLQFPMTVKPCKRHTK